jgi:hypothetical protein
MRVVLAGRLVLTLVFLSRFLKEDARMCDLVCDDGARFKVRCGIQGHLLEMNPRLSACPDALNNKPGQASPPFQPLYLSQSIRAHQFGEPGPFSAPKLAHLFRIPSNSIREKSRNPSDAELQSLWTKN